MKRKKKSPLTDIHIFAFARANLYEDKTLGDLNIFS